CPPPAGSRSERSYRAFSGLLGGQQREGKRGAPPRGGLDPNPPPMALDDLLTDGQSDSRSRVLVPPMQTLEDHEDAVEVALLDPDAVVSHAEHPEGLVIAGPGRNLDGGRLCPVELEGIG